jgi:hypothetical protein
MNCKPLGQLFGTMRTKNRMVDRLDRAIGSTNPEHAAFRESTLAEIEKLTAAIAQLPRLTDVTLNIRKAGPPAAPQ